MTRLPSSETPEEQLFSIAEHCRIPLRRLDGETLHDVAARLTLEIEQSIALMLLDLEEIATLNLEEDPE